MSKISATLGLFNLLLLAVFAASAIGIAGISSTAGMGLAFTQLTGFLSLGMMAFAAVLSTRQKWLEPSLGGLDKMYRLHKWLGIGALAIAVVHWLVRTGGGHRPPVEAAAAAANAVASTVTAAASAAAPVERVIDPAVAATQTLFPSLMGLAHMIAQPVLFLLIALIAAALVKLIPYRIFQKLHFVMAAVFLVFAFHALVLMRPEYWPTPFGWATVTMAVTGSIASVYSLVRHFIGFPGAEARVVETHYYPELKVLEVDLEVDERWKGHRPGQFAFVVTDLKEGAHPFTIATSWNPANRRIGFIAKELGDFTSGLRREFHKGARVKIEGPYGRFTFDSAKPCQIWIGGGIGITPFVAKMRERAGTPANTQIHLFHTTRQVSEDALNRMRADADAASVDLHVLVSPRDGHLDAKQIMETVADWKDASFWFCGPTGFGAILRKDLVGAGLQPADFHQELFEMR
ncbi:ferric reductase-like transmembrane domain-containing protein [Pleomorphomonas sp. PLEO]|uniref:ferredoxin reductase family protein n=1 Tax=Pleomorphomonas sp. PLEO TaxID=3239306 RepID=UPI00351DFC7A